MKHLLREERIMALCAVIFLMVCVGYYNVRNHPVGDRTVLTSRAAQSTISEVQMERDIPKTIIQGEKINLNTASVKDLERLPQIGASRAEEIVKWREIRGAFRTVRDLMKVSGIGEGIYAQIEPYITVGEIP